MYGTIVSTLHQIVDFSKQLLSWKVTMELSINIYLYIIIIVIIIHAHY